MVQVRLYLKVTLIWDGGFSMANLQKYTKSATGHLTKHFERAKDINGDYIKFGNQDIDIQKSHLNYNLAPEHVQSSQITINIWFSLWAKWEVHEKFEVED